MATGKIIRVLCDDTLPFVNELVWSKVCSNGAVFSLFLENKPNLKKKVILKGRKSSSSLSYSLFEVLKVCHLRDQPNRQTNKVTTITF